MNSNSFNFGNPICDPTRFCGRQAEIRRMVNLYRVKDNEIVPRFLKAYTVRPQKIWYIRKPNLKEYFSLSDCGSTTIGIMDWLGKGG
jgi:hypothetical protein